MKLLRYLPILALALLLTQCMGREVKRPELPGLKPLTASQLQKLVDGSSLSMNGYGQTATVDFNQDGSMTGSNRAGEQDAGQWKVMEDELCLRFKKWGAGDVNCYQVVEREGEKYELFNRKGMPVYDLIVVKHGDSTSEHEAAPTMGPTATKPSSPTGMPPATMPEPVPESPHAAEDVNFIIRHNAHNCPGCNLAHADLSGQSLIGANLQGANLTEANLSHANLRRANLKGANLYRADLRGADLTGADLTGANMSEAFLK